MVYVAVLSYFSVAFMGLSTLPAWLQACVIAENPDATPDEVAVIYGTRYSAFTFVQGTVTALVAGWAGALSDRFGRRRCAALPAIGQAVGSAVLALTAYYELDWRVGLAGWTVSGALGGPLVFLASAFAYMADWTPQERRGRTFAGLEGSMLYVSAIGPLLSSRVVQLWGLLAATETRRSAVGFAGLWGTCAAVYAVSPVCFALAQPSPQVRVPPAPCALWWRRSTPALVGALLCEGRGGLNRLCAAFVLATSSSAGGVSAFLLYAQRYLHWEVGKIGLYVALFAVTTGTMILCNTLILPRLLARCGGRPPPHDLSMVRGAYLGPPVYLLLLYLAPLDAREAVAFWAIPLLGCGACAIPHLRALFSAARPAERQGETMAMVAALESIPQMVASPLCALAFTRMLSAPQFIFVAAAAPVLLALLLLASLRRASLRPHRDEGCAPPILVADPRRRLLLAGGDADMVPTSPCATTAQSVLGPTPPTAAASGHQVRQTGES